MKTSPLLLTLLLVAGAASAEGFKPGLWEFSSQMQGANAPAMPKLSPAEQAQMEAAMKQLPKGMKLPGGMQMGSMGAAPGGGMAFTVTQCLKDNNPVPPTRSGPGGQECKPTQVEQKGNTVTWAVHCEGKDSQMDGQGTATYSGDTMTSSMKMKGTSHGAPVDMAMTTSGRYLGACK